MPSSFNNAIDHSNTDLTSPSVPNNSPDSSGTPQSPYNPISPLPFSPSAVTSPHNSSSTSSPSTATSFPVPSDQNQNPPVSSPELSNQSIAFPTPIPPIRQSSRTSNPPSYLSDYHCANATGGNIISVILCRAKVDEIWRGKRLKICIRVDTVVRSKDSSVAVPSK
ncbi:unnamed protein product [Vicia faba]|uniref:Uncharacterized protein n=1 Tax=Vicia faba TaxID=3906 RepID=A0AAV0YY22_VICFA|nr:unnamed protein product [Vicia faba]